MQSIVGWQTKRIFFKTRFAPQLIRLAVDLARRDIQAKYKRSLAGLCWFVLTPLGNVGLYWTIFGQIFHVSWRDPLTKDSVGFVLPFFAGLAFYLFFTDLIVSSANLFVAKRNYVKKSAFPLWVLWLANMIRAGAYWSVNVGILLLLAIAEQRLTLLGLFWMTPAILTGLLFAGALSLLISCFGPFIGDINEAAGLILRVVFYTAPVTYTVSLVPENYRVFLWFNPLTHVVEPMRRAIVFSTQPELSLLILFNILSSLLLGLSLWVFRRTRGIIADVV
jgi:lipopolysaccharide transport system permease protein